MDADLIPGLPADIGLECLVKVPHHHLPSVAAVCRSWRREIELPAFWRHRKASGLTQKIVVMAQAWVDPTQENGSKKCPVVAAAPVYRLTVCEPESGFWAELPPVPGFSGGLPMFCQVVGVGHNLVVVGGWDPATQAVTNDVFVYNFLSAAWRRGARMLGGPRLFFACGSDLDRMVFVAGGHDEEKCALRSALMYDVLRDDWTALPDMGRERDEPKGVFQNGIFRVIGGYSTNMQGGFGASSEAFDVATGVWCPVEENFLINATCPRNCAVSGDGRLFMCTSGAVVALEGSGWRIVAELPRDVQNTAYVAAWEGKVLVVGSEKFGAAFKMFVLDLESCKWERVAVEEEFSGHVQSGCCLEL